MEVYVLDVYGSARVIPQVPTYAIRINNTGKGRFKKDDLQGEFCLRESGLWVAVNEYAFDDLDYIGSGQNDPNSIKPKTARKIVVDFDKIRKRCLAVMINCHSGEHRGISVGMALNELFHLGLDNKSLMARWYLDYNKLVYDAIVEAGRKILR